MTALYLSRARLRSLRGEALSAIAPILIPDDPSSRTTHAHRLVWLLFQDQTDAVRDFLWRDDGAGRYLVLSHRPPADPLGLFELDTKLFQPSLAAGDRLAFALRANPVTTTKRAGSKPGKAGRARGKRVDVVMDALHKLPPGQRAAARDQTAVEAGRKWLDAQGGRAGFKLTAAPVVKGYHQISLADAARGRRVRATLSVLDLEGAIEVTDPAVFVARLGQGFGAGKAFGNGLMLIRRA